jgi:thioester reductase-like protein
MSTVFFTGFPGFLGSELLPLILLRTPSANAVCLVQPRYVAQARQRASDIEARVPATKHRIHIVEGDITHPTLGLSDADATSLHNDVTEIYHLAAVYDLSVPRDFALRVNVDGTRHVLDFAERCTTLARFQYVSTCYVSGTHPGIFRETDLECGQQFNNFYEETKYLAEVDVRRRMHNGLPATIYRPSIVVGDSTTGATQKYDGPYFVIQLLLRQPRIAIIPVSGNPRKSEFNAVPRDFVVRAIAHLSALSQSLGKTYQLADPRPLLFDDLLTTLVNAADRVALRVPAPLALARWSLDHLPGMYQLLRVPSSALAYQVHPTRYDTRNATTDLQMSGITCPPFPSYAKALVHFARQHPEIGAAAMV